MNTYLLSMTGGLLIGIAAVLGYGLFGKITGISGISYQALTQIIRYQLTDKWPWLFLMGLPLGGFIAQQCLNLPPPIPTDSQLWRIILAGLLVGVGSQLGNGCTSGHGICGIGRLSKRSFIATGIFMLAGVITAESMH